jgi:hypothetical protein
MTTQLSIHKTTNAAPSNLSSVNPTVFVIEIQVELNFYRDINEIIIFSKIPHNT